MVVVLFALPDPHVLQFPTPIRCRIRKKLVFESFDLSPDICCQDDPLCGKNYFRSSSAKSYGAIAPASIFPDVGS